MLLYFQHHIPLFCVIRIVSQHLNTVTLQIVVMLCELVIDFPSNERSVYKQQLHISLLFKQRGKKLKRNCFNFTALQYSFGLELDIVM